ncbi:hypothetical protein N7530_008672 [Penicillium desertorum]|uniref:Metallo-beta-lactamase domain-containing protein n=1 Tax=Penicillium desertorum TaxID=1303715 RepID=A0A9W9WPJ4_9EURO|nr:hypothetical protein N7530_008672 [Penicillium desertorum]
MCTISIHALHAGYLTLPEAFFVTPLEDPTARTTVPSLSFLIQHTNSETSKTTRFVFDLGIRQKLSNYSQPIYNHAMTRRPLSGDPDTVASLAAGGLTPDDIDFVIFSHLHWDHIGTPSDYPGATYVIGPGAASLISGTRKLSNGSHSHFEEGILDLQRTIELPSTASPNTPPPFEDEGVLEPQSMKRSALFSKAWHPKGRFQHCMDVFDDGSLYIVSAPGHLDGHINLLCRKSDGDYVYLAGDAFHDARLLSGEKEIATWSDPAYPKSVCCIHSNKDVAEDTLARIRATLQQPGELGTVEVVFAHDGSWEREAEKQGRFFPGRL